jgi:histidinol-phosphatase (PHP family)
MWFNYHTHSTYCDGKGGLSEYVAKATQLGLAQLGFSSHAPLPFDCKWCMKSDALNDYLDEIEHLKGLPPGIELYKGLEVDFIPGIIEPHSFKDDLDYTIGSVHFVDAFADGRRWEIDGPHSSFLDGLRSIFSNDIQAVVSRYFELTREMISTSCPAVLGHLDKIKIQNIDEKFFSESDAWYQVEMKKTIESILQTGVIVEVNTRGLYQKKSLTTYPSPWVLQLLLEKNIPVTISSDAHHPDDLIKQFHETARLLNKTGFKKLTVLRNGTWQQFDFNEDGVNRH